MLHITAYHLWEISYIILTKKFFLSWFENGDSEWIHEQTGFKDVLLHATALSFRHPEDKSVCEVSCPMPDDMQKFWDRFTLEIPFLSRRFIQFFET